jgi:hypothetical protein
MTQELLGRVHRELIDVLNSINQDKIHHDGDDFHELLNDVEKALAQPEQEPVVHDPLPRACNLAGVDYQTFLKIKAYMPITPPQRTWVWLTKVERIELLESTHPNNRWSLLALCEALLKEKNT